METMNEYDAAVRTQYKAQRGFYGRESLPLQSWLWDDNGTLKAMAITTTGKVGFGYNTDANITNQISALIWNASADNTEAIHRNWDIPDDFARSSERAGTRARIMLRFRVRKNDASGISSDNATLQMKLDVAVQTPNLDLKTGVETDGDTSTATANGIVAKTIADQDANTVAASCFIPAKPATGAANGLRWMEVDISAALTSAQMAAVKAGGTIGLKLYPSAAIGTGLTLEVSNLEMVYSRNLQPANIRNKSLCTRA